MERYFGSENFPKGKRTAVALGNFDGVHVGHRALIDVMLKEAARKGLTSLIYTFDPHPARVLSPRHSPALLQTLPQRLKMIEDLNVDCSVVERFSNDFAKMEAGEFIEKILKGRLSANAIVTGYDFTFGLHRHGNIATLKDIGEKHKIEVIAVDAQFFENTLVSSTNIRRMLAEGDVWNASLLLGRAYSIEGRVVAGRGVGGKLGFHTANIETLNEVVPLDGVYISGLKVLSGGEGTLHPSLTSIGDNPTFPESNFTIETHVIDFKGDLLGKDVEVIFYERLREQAKFASPEALGHQIERDVEVGKKYHASKKRKSK